MTKPILAKLVLMDCLVITMDLQLELEHFVAVFAQLDTQVITVKWQMFAQQVH